VPEIAKQPIVEERVTVPVSNFDAFVRLAKIFSGEERQHLARCLCRPGALDGSHLGSEEI
tara:strand:+ start:953 stop:1132 length:180 start_codon:yes stop_codon:yes gene_type:complete